MPKYLALLPVLLAGLAGCASYRPRPLDLHPALPASVARLALDPARMPFASLRKHRFDPSNGLDIDEVAMLAVARNPALTLARDQLGVKRAQAFATGLPPDPQLGLSRDTPTNGGPGAASAFTLGLSYDVNALLARPAAKKAAAAAVRQSALSLQWKEWQVVSRARALFVNHWTQKRLMALLQDNRRLFATRCRNAQQALRQGNTVWSRVSADLTALQDIDRRINALERRINQNRHELNALLGLAPQTQLRLTGSIRLAPLDTAQIKTALSHLARRRPDLLALQAGYESQEARFRQAILAQFPALNIGLTRARDTAGLYTHGFGVTLSLPFFNRNHGNIAIERATRQRLHDAFTARVNSAAQKVSRILADQTLLMRRLAQVQHVLPRLTQMNRSARMAFQAGNLNAQTYVSLHAAWLAKRIAAVTLEQTLLEQRIALQTLIGGKLPLTSMTRDTRS
ncbi:MAG TPA: TolC family protein [Betaproteobacteria bacterium]|nr:TolC family protein [Betaproteobacteria bacterium]